MKIKYTEKELKKMPFKVQQDRKERQGKETSLDDFNQDGYEEDELDLSDEGF